MKAILRECRECRFTTLFVLGMMMATAIHLALSIKMHDFNILPNAHMLLGVVKHL